jgi:hypothetical protein
MEIGEHIIAVVQNKVILAERSGVRALSSHAAA